MAEWRCLVIDRPMKFGRTRWLKRLSKRALVERVWVAEYTAEGAMEIMGERSARIAELIDMLEGRRPVDADMIAAEKEHAAHIVACQQGSCEHDYAALVRASAVPEINARVGGALKPWTQVVTEASHD